MLGQRLIKYSNITISFAVFEFVLILCIPLVNIDGSLIQRVGAYIIAAAFWISIVMECVFSHLSTYERKYVERKEYRNRTLKHSQPGVISFFKNLEATIVDIILFLSAIIVVIIAWLQVKTGWMIITCTSVLFLSFNLHCILNGKNYRYIKALRLYKKEQERDE